MIYNDINVGNYTLTENYIIHMTTIRIYVQG